MVYLSKNVIHFFSEWALIKKKEQSRPILLNNNNNYIYCMTACMVYVPRGVKFFGLQF